MTQRKAATIFTAIIFIIACAFLYMHFNTPTESDTIIKNCYYIGDLKSPQKKVTNSNFDMKVTATQGNHLYIEIKNNTAAQIQLEEKARIYKVQYDGTRAKVNPEGIKIYITRGEGRAEIVKKIAAGDTREAVYDCYELGALTPGAYIVTIYGQHIFFEIEANPNK